MEERHYGQRAVGRMIELERRWSYRTIRKSLVGSILRKTRDVARRYGVNALEVGWLTPSDRLKRDDS